MALHLGLYIAETEEVIDITEYWRPDSGWKASRGLDETQPSLPARAGHGSLVLDNTDGVFDPVLTMLIPGRLVQCRWTDDVNDNLLFTGVIDRPKNNFDIGNRSVELNLLGTFSLLTGKPPLGHGPLSTQLYILLRTDEIITIILDQLGWPAAARDLDEGDTIVAYWWAEGTDPWTAILEMVNAEGPLAYIYEREDGAFVFRKNMGESVGIDWEPADFPGEPIQINRPIEYDDGRANTVNYARWELQQRIFDAEVSDIWEYNEELPLDPDEVITFGISSNSGDPFTGTVTLLEGTDYVILSGSVDSISLDRESGQVATLTIVAGAGGVEFSFLKVRARLVAVIRDTVYINTIGAPLDTGVAKQSFNGPTWPGVFEQYIRANLNTMVELFSSGRAVAEINLTSISDANREMQANAQIGHRILLHSVAAGIDSGFWIIGIDHEVEPGPVLRTRFVCVAEAVAPPTPEPPEGTEYSPVESGAVAEGYEDQNPLAYYLAPADNSLAISSHFVDPDPFFGPPVDRAATMGGFRFENIAIAQGQTIVEARFSTYGNSAPLYKALYATMAFEDVDDSQPFPEGNPLVWDRVMQTSPTPHHIESEDQEGLDLDVTVWLQAIVDRVGWVSGNSVMWLMKGDPVPGDSETWVGGMRTDLSYGPKLTVTL